ncbi:MAG: hypothetical protein EZS28_004861 [Streblomastix strix]|uniref:Uncharacterized protein n=1 Tax=Streblomastix strix TaxID=222440 RepID=A0A5J4WXT3_9EUKA|nr:MAG: hypothetical protein EZS28_004861 [Streblomastix strix]
MGFSSKIANFGSKILGGVKHAAQWVAAALHKVLSTVAGPVGMIHPAVGSTLGAGAGLAGAVDRLIRAVRQFIRNDIAQYIQYSKRGRNSVYAANNQFIDGQASYFALKIAADINQLQSTVGSIDADIVGVKNELLIIRHELARQQHFRGYYLLNSDITSLPDSADGDFAFSAESGTVWMYDTAWYNSGQVVPDQVSPASDAVPLVDNATGAAGISTAYARRDHQHPLQISSVLPSADTATGEAGTANIYVRSDHTHHVNLSNDIPLKDSGTGQAGSSYIYASAQHQHPPKINPTVVNVPLIGGLATEILCANGDTTTIDSKISRTYNSSGGGWIRLSPTKVSTNYAIDNGVNQLFHTHSGSADGNTLTFNGSVIAGVGATNGATNGSVNYSAGNPILWGVNSVGTEVGFYSNGTNI